MRLNGTSVGLNGEYDRTHPPVIKFEKRKQWDMNGKIMRNHPENLETNPI
jgi:hypothetical protein